MLEYIDPIYYRGLRNRYIGYASLTTRRLLDHIYGQYGVITQADLQENEYGIKDPYATNIPIDILFGRIEDGTVFAENANDLYTAAHPWQ